MTVRAKGRQHVQAKDQFATMGDVGEAFNAAIAMQDEAIKAYHQFYVKPLADWMQWRSLPWYKRAWITLRRWWAKVRSYARP